MTKVRNAGLTLIELMIAITISLIVVLLVGILLESGQKSWARAFTYANSETQLEALTTTITFGKIGRQSNRQDYKIYEVLDGPRFFPAAAPANPDEVITGQAVEFHYWDKELEDHPEIMDTSISGTAYALFYLDGNKLKLDIGDCQPGAVDAAGNLIEGANASTITLAENVTALEFSHTVINTEGKGKGCVRMSMTIYDPVEKRSTTVTAATLMRNVWP
jgi:prepilin-type N-terminal cleavage/methylation domain-containing protein